jgi:sugar lactone lactonase YvrE
MTLRKTLALAMTLAAAMALWGCSSSDSPTDPCGEKAASDPIAMLTSNVKFGNVRTPFRFDASASEDPDCSSRKLYYRWDTNADGTIDVPASGWSESPTLELNFATEGNHLVVVHVSSDGNATSKRSASAGLLVEIVTREYAAIETWVGTGLAGGSADGTPLRATDLFTTMDITLTDNGTAYIADWQNHKIVTVRDGKTYRVCGTGTLGDAPEGTARNAGLNHPTNISIDPQGRLVMAAWHNSMVMRIDPVVDSFVRLAGIRPAAGTNSNRCYEPADEGQPAIDACMDLPSGTAFDSDGNLYIADQKNIRIVRVSAVNGIITDHNETGPKSIFETIVGVPCDDPSNQSAPNCPDGGFNGNGIPAAQAFLSAPGSQSADPTSRIAIHDDVLYLADTENHQIRKVNLKVANPTIELVAGSIDLDASGRPLAGVSAENIAAAGAKLNRPCDVAVDDDGNVFIADTRNHRIRRVDAVTGLITTVAGSGANNPPCIYNGGCDYTDDGALGDGGDSLLAYLQLPYGIDLDSAGNLYIVDTYHHRVRIVYK